jgi:hypothetical protein
MHRGIAFSSCKIIVISYVKYRFQIGIQNDLIRLASAILALYFSDLECISEIRFCPVLFGTSSSRSCEQFHVSSVCGISGVNELKCLQLTVYLDRLSASWYFCIVTRPMVKLQSLGAVPEPSCH